MKILLWTGNGTHINNLNLQIYTPLPSFMFINVVVKINLVNVQLLM